MSESNCQYVCSRGIMKSCDIYSFKPISSIKQLKNYDFSKMYHGCTLYICSSAIPHFQSLLNQIPFSFILVSGDGDDTVPNDLFSSKLDFLKFIEHPKIIHWFSQNCFLVHAKMSQIPIGLDFHTLAHQNHEWGNQKSPIEQEAQLIDIRSRSKPFSRRICKAYANFQFLMQTRYGQDRREALSKIPAELVYYETIKTKRYDTWTRQVEYAFVISPHGNGYDCHRTWEALCLGCIPIVKSSCLDSLFADLPVLVVKDWCNVTEELLISTISLFENKKMNMEKLLLKYWIDLIQKPKKR